MRTAVLPVWFLERGAEIQRAVARVVLAEEVSGMPVGAGWATGFMVAPDLFMTCNHVIPTPDFANKLAVQFNYRLQMDGLVQETEIFRLSPGDLYITNHDLDYTEMVKKLAGGSKGCAHLTALFIAMAPAAVQGFWAHYSQKPIQGDAPHEAMRKFLVDTCYVWRKDGPLMQELRNEVQTATGKPL